MLEQHDDLADLFTLQCKLCGKYFADPNELSKHRTLEDLANSGLFTTDSGDEKKGIT